MSGDVEVEDWQWVIGWWCGSLGGMGEGCSWWLLAIPQGASGGGVRLAVPRLGQVSADATAFVPGMA